MEVQETFIVQLKDGNELTVQASTEFMDKVRDHYKLASHNEVTKELVKNFLLGSLEGALQKIEQ